MSLAISVGAVMPRLPSFGFPMIRFSLAAYLGALPVFRNGFPPFFIDDGMILRAVPKKKPSYARTRTKLYASGDKKIKPLHNLVRCPACGSVKRSHFMCMNCFAEIRQFVKSIKNTTREFFDPAANMDSVDKRIVFPGKRISEYERRLKEKKWVPQRERAILFDAGQVKYKK